MRDMEAGITEAGITEAGMKAGEEDATDTGCETRYDGGVVDLHCHTKASDNSMTAREVARTARESGVRYLAITDHDTTIGLGWMPGSRGSKSCIRRIRRRKRTRRHRTRCGSDCWRRAAPTSTACTAAPNTRSARKMPE